MSAEELKDNIFLKVNMQHPHTASQDRFYIPVISAQIACKVVSLMQCHK